MAYAVTSPDRLEMIVGEKLNLTVDFSGVLGPSPGTLSSPVVTVGNAEANETVPSAIIGSPSLAGSILSVTISSAHLRPSTEYVASFSCVVTDATSGLTGNATIYLLIEVVY